MAIQFKYPVEINAASGTSCAALSLTNNSAGSSAVPIFNLYRDSASPANVDSTGQLSFQANNSVGSKREYVRSKVNYLNNKDVDELTMVISNMVDKELEYAE